MGRAPCCEKVGLKKGPWTPLEGMKLVNYINSHGHGNWRALPKQAGLLRCGKSCRLRWINYLRPDIKHGNFTLEEEETIIRLHDLLANKWSAIVSRLPGRTDNEIKNVWNTHIQKRLKSKENNSSVPDGSKESPSSSSESQISFSTNFVDKLDGHTEQIGFEDMLRILDEPPVGLFDLLDEFREDSTSFVTDASTSVRQDGSAIDQESSCQAMLNDKDGNESWYKYLERELELGPEDQMHQGSLDGVESFVDERSHSSQGLSCASNDPIALYFETLPSPHDIPTFYL